MGMQAELSFVLLLFRDQRCSGCSEEGFCQGSDGRGRHGFAGDAENAATLTAADTSQTFSMNQSRCF